MIKTRKHVDESRLFLRFYVRGFAYYDGLAAMGKMHEGDELDMFYEPKNAYDHNAISLYAGNLKLGYVPRESNYDLALFTRLGHGDLFECKVLAVRPENAASSMLEVAIYVKERFACAF